MAASNIHINANFLELRNQYLISTNVKGNLIEFCFSKQRVDVLVLVASLLCIYIYLKSAKFI